jgi:hypothetical protein
MTSWKQTEMEAMLFEVWDLRDETEKMSSVDLRSIRALAEACEFVHLTLIKEFPSKIIIGENDDDYFVLQANE